MYAEVSIAQTVRQKDYYDQVIAETMACIKKLVLVIRLFVGITSQALARFGHQIVVVTALPRLLSTKHVLVA